MRWSPIFCLPKATLTTSGLLDLENGEVEILTRKDVGLRIYNPIPMINETKENDSMEKRGIEYVDCDPDLICTLTTHRLVFLENTLTGGKTDGRKNSACFIPLSLVGCASSKGFGILASPKLKMTTYTYGDVSLSFEASGDRDEMLTSLSRCLGRKAWEATSRQQLLKPVSKDTAKKVGVDAILSKNKEWHEGAKRISEDAFSRDVEGLMTEARDLVLVINKYVATLENKKKLEGSNNGQVVVINEEEERLSEMLSHMGMMSAITKKSSGSLYHQQLARQLADFLIQSNIVIKQGGMITLADVYCLFNRARGTNLITPGDMLTVAQILKDLHLGYEKREFASGVVVLQSVDYSDQMVSEKLKEMSRSHPSGLTVFFVSSQLKTNTILAMEQLQTAESMGFLCRDTTIEGVRFFENKFILW